LNILQMLSQLCKGWVEERTRVDQHKTENNIYQVV